MSSEIYTCHTGGAEGSDLAWETIGREYDVDSISYSFVGHNQFGRTQKFLTKEEIVEGAEKANAVAEILGRPWNRIENNHYVKCLLARNWFQVKNSSSVYAIGRFANKSRTIVDGGTGWAIQMAITFRRHVSIYIFDQDSSSWYKYSQSEKCFVKCDVPTLTLNFAGIGTRELRESGKKAIRAVYDKTFKKTSQTSHSFFEEL